MIEKKKLAELEKCYCVAPLEYQNKKHILVAAEKTDKCKMFDLDGNFEQDIWDGPGGVMTMEQVPNTNGQFLSTQKFYSPNDSLNAKIVVATPNEKGAFDINVLVNLPFVHRFGILTSGGVHYLIACALKSGHEHKDDWRFDGRIFVAELPEDLTSFNEDNCLKMDVLVEGVHKNHGFCKHEKNGTIGVLVGSESGVYEIFPPAQKGDEWKVEVILKDPVSDMIAIDFDGDGEKELMTYSKFHGDQITIYKRQNGEFKVQYAFEQKFDFLHAIASMTLEGKQVAVVGHRGAEKNLFIIYFDSGEYKIGMIDESCGSANALTYVHNNNNYIVAANREINEINLYCVNSIPR